MHAPDSKGDAQFVRCSFYGRPSPPAPDAGYPEAVRLTFFAKQERVFYVGAKHAVQLFNYWSIYMCIRSNIYHMGCRQNV